MKYLSKLVKELSTHKFQLLRLTGCLLAIADRFIASHPSIDTDDEDEPRITVTQATSTSTPIQISFQFQQ